MIKRICLAKVPGKPGIPRTLFTFLLSFLLVQGCTVNNVRIDNKLKRFFEERNTEGCFALFDNLRGEFTIYNLARDTVRYSPASTFKIVNSLIALQTGRITDDSTVIKWDGITRDRPEWNQDLSLYRAFRYSSVPHFQEIARRIGRDTMQVWLDSIKYGNRKIGEKLDAFWLDNSLRISPDEQLWLVKKLYFRQLPFREGVQETVKHMMIQENNSKYQLAYKTGWGETPEGNPMGWMVGWVEENRHPYFFVLNLESPDKNIDMVKARSEILNDILKDLGFFKGKL